jgi:hypothetical protein
LHIVLRFTSIFTKFSLHESGSTLRQTNPSISAGIR